LAYWKENFNAAFKSRVRLPEGLQVKYCGEDFVKSVPVKADYAQMADELGVDAVLGFNLVGHNETYRLASLVQCIFGMRESSFAEFHLHFCYLHVEDWPLSLDFMQKNPNAKE
jgi:hypothetical protein